MSKAKKDLRATKKAAREEQQGKRIIQWIAGVLIALLFISVLFWAIL